MAELQSLTYNELVRLLEAVPNERQRAMLLVTFWHGLRVSETLALTPESFTDGYLTVQRLKGSERTVQKLNVHPLDILNERAAVGRLLAESVPNTLLFPLTRFGFYKLMQRAGKLAGLPKHKCHPHALKHTCARYLLDDLKLDIAKVKKRLGHKSGGSTLEYLKESDDAVDNAVAAAVGV